MDKFQVLRRVYDEASDSWSASWHDPNLDERIQVGYSEDFRLDKQTDTANIKIKYKGLNKPDWKPTDWCRIIHEKEGEEGLGATYDSEGLPLNHNQYTIKNISAIQNKLNEYWLVTLELMEPIENLRGVLCETMAFTNQVEKKREELVDGKMVEVTYTKEPLNHLSVLEKILKVTPANNDLSKSWYSRIDILNKDFLENIPFNDDVYNEPSLYEILLNKYDSSTGRTPVIFFDIATETINKTEYFNFTDKTFPDSNFQAGQSFNNCYLEIGQSPELGFYGIGEPQIITKNQEVYDFYIIHSPTSVTRHLGTLTPPLPPLGVPLFVPFIHELKCEKKVVNQVKDLPKNPARAEYKLKFIRQDGFDRPEILIESLTNKAAKIICTQTLDNYAEGIVSNVENLIANTNNAHPAQNLWAVPEQDSDKREIDKNTKWIIRTKHKIKNIIGIKAINTALVFFDTELKEVDLSKFIYEEKEYKASEYVGKENSDAIWFKEGTNKIYLDGFNNLNNLWICNIVYEPLINCRIDNAKDYQIPINQMDSQIDSKKYAEYTNNYLQGMNKADFIIQKTYNHYYNIKEVGTSVVDGDKTYIITNVSIVNRNFQYDAIYQLNENHLRKSDSIIAPQKIRNNVEIGFNELSERKICLQENIDFSLSAIKNKKTYNFINDIKDILNVFINNSANIENFPQAALLQIKNEVSRNGIKEKQEKIFISEFIRFAFNNSIYFNVKMIDNAEIGKLKNMSTPLVGQFKINSQVPVLYTNAFGELDMLSLWFGNINKIQLKNDNPISNIFDPESYVNVVKKLAQMPNVSEDLLNQITTNKSFQINNWLIYKDMLDNLNLSVAISVNFKEKNVIVCEEFLYNSRLMTSDESPYNIKILAFNENKNKYDNIDNFIWESEITESQINNNYLQMKFNKKEKLNCKSLIFIKDDKKLLIINNVDRLSQEFTDNFNNGIINVYF